MSAGMEVVNSFRHWKQREITGEKNKSGLTITVSSEVVWCQCNYTCFVWAGGTFFLVVLNVVSVFGSSGKKVLVQFWFKYVFTT